MNNPENYPAIFIIGTIIWCILLIVVISIGTNQSDREKAEKRQDYLLSLIAEKLGVDRQLIDSKPPKKSK